MENIRRQVREVGVALDNVTQPGAVNAFHLIHELRIETVEKAITFGKVDKLLSGSHGDQFADRRIR